MTEQSPSDRLNRASNDIFEATSFLNGTNAAFIEQMYAAWIADPASVDAGWQSYFSQQGDPGLSPAQLGRGPSRQDPGQVGAAQGVTPNSRLTVKCVTLGRAEAAESSTR